jgi:hypothetical protein
MDFGSLPQFPSGAEDGSPERGPMPDRHGADFAIGVLLVAAAVGVAALVALAGLLLLSGVGAYPGLA